MSARRVWAAIATVIAAVALAAPAARAATQTFTAPGEQPFTVPPGVTSIHVVAVGGAGGAGKGYSKSIAGGFGAVASGDIAVSSGQILYVVVGGNGISPTGLPGGAGGFNGGGTGGTATFTEASGGGGGGGGASDVRTVPGSSPGTLASRLIVAAGGGGGGGSNTGGPGGSAGSPGTASTATEFGTSAGAGGAGGQAAGGTAGVGTGGGISGDAGSLGIGGKGGTSTMGAPTGGGGGGGGLYGGGGGAGSSPSLGSGGGGGGGGSSGFAAGVTNTALAVDAGGAPSVTLTYTVAVPGPDATAPRLSSILLSPVAFEAANIGGSTISAAVGTNVVYEVSEASTTTFAVQRAVKGFKKGRKCVAKKPAGKAPRCIRYVKVKGSFTHSGAQGLNRFRFTGRVGNKSLRKGRYKLTGVAKDPAGNSSKPLGRGFRIVG